MEVEKTMNEEALSIEDAKYWVEDAAKEMWVGNPRQRANYERKMDAALDDLVAAVRSGHEEERLREALRVCHDAAHTTYLSHADLVHTVHGASHPLIDARAVAMQRRAEKGGR